MGKSEFQFLSSLRGKLGPGDRSETSRRQRLLEKEKKRGGERRKRERERKNGRREDKEKVRVGRNPNLNCFETSNVIACFVRYEGGKKGIVFIWIEASSKARLI